MFKINAMLEKTFKPIYRLGFSLIRIKVTSGFH